MIHNTAAFAAINLAQEFDSRKLILDAVEGTPLAELNKTFYLKQCEVKPIGEVEYTPEVDFIVGTSGDWGAELRGEPVLHTQTLDKLSDEISTHVQNHLRFAKTVVKPIIAELVEEMKKDISSIDTSPFNKTKIVQYSLPTPLVDPSLVDSIMAYKDSALVTDLKYMTFSEKLFDEISELLLLNQSVDSDIKNWAATKGVTYFEQLWASVFTPAGTENNFSTLRTGADAADNCLAVFLLCSKLIDNPPEDTNQTLGNYNAMLNDFKSQAALRLIGLIEEYNAFVSIGLLIKSSNIKEITIVSDVYKAWMETGGNDAFILASTLLDRPYKYVTDINEHKVQLQTIWDRHVALLQTTEYNNRYVKYIQFLKERTLKVVADNFNLCYQNLREDGNVDANLPEYLLFKDKLDDFITTLSAKDFDNIWDLSLRVISECVFFYTDAGKILKGIDEACKFNPTLTVSEAALLSTIQYVAPFVFDQIKITSL